MQLLISKFIRITHILQEQLLLFFIFFSLSFICSILIGLVLYKNTQCKHKKHYTLIIIFITRFILTLVSLFIYRAVDNVNISGIEVFTLSLVVEIYAIVVWFFVWILVVKTIRYIILDRRDIATAHKEISDSSNITDSTVNSICSTFTRSWIDNYIKLDKTRYNTLANHKELYIAKLTTELSNVSKRPEVTAELYWKHCLDLWKNN